MGSPLKHKNNCIQVFCSWNCNTPSKSISDSVKLCDKQSTRVTLDDIVDLETCIQLFAEDSSTPVPCTVNFKAVKHYLITKLSIISEAKLVELYGKCEEYLGTYHAEYIDIFEDMAVNSLDLDLLPTNECSIKFAKMRHKKSLWLYGIHVTLVEEESSSVKSDLDLLKIEERLKSSNQPITEKAFKCKEFLRTYHLNKPNIVNAPKVPDPIMLLKMLEGEFLTSLLAQTESPPISKSLPQNSSQSFSAKDSDLSTATTCRRNSRCSTLESGHCSVNGSIIENSDLKYYLDEKFSQLEDRLISVINNKLKIMEEKYAGKVDAILNLLEKKVPDRTVV